MSFPVVEETGLWRRISMEESLADIQVMGVQFAPSLPNGGIALTARAGPL